VLRAPAVLVLTVAAALAASGCGADEAVADRAAREAFCAQWRAVTEVGSRVDDPAVREAIANGADRLREVVPADQQDAIDRVVEEARRLAEQADSGTSTDEEAAAQAQQAFDEAFSEVQATCEGTLLG
jgi:hypothetical protein